LRNWCFNLECQAQQGLKIIRRRKAALAKDERKQRRVARERIKSRSEWLKDAQKEFNAYVRARDAGKPCISCGRRTGCKMNAGHYKTTAGVKGLRFHPANCHLQCEKCNMHLSGNIHGYRGPLLAKVGPEMLNYLDNAHPFSGWTIEEIKEIKAHFHRMARELNEKL